MYVMYICVYVKCICTVEADEVCRRHIAIDVAEFILGLPDTYTTLLALKAITVNSHSNIIKFICIYIGDNTLLLYVSIQRDRYCFTLCMWRITFFLIF